MYVVYFNVLQRSMQRRVTAFSVDVFSHMLQAVPVQVPAFFYVLHMSGLKGRLSVGRHETKPEHFVYIVHAYGMMLFLRFSPVLYLFVFRL